MISPPGEGGLQLVLQDTILEIQPKTQKLDKMRCSPDMIFGPKTFGKGLFG
jgi:hypothetical protein